jgi:hypothetical protein
LGVSLLAAVIGVSGCGSGGSALPATGAAASTASIAGRLVASAATSLEGTEVVAEELVGGRTATVRAIAAEPNSSARISLLATLQAGSPPHLPGVYTTRALADGSFQFHGLPLGDYSLTARNGSLVGALTNMHVGGVHTAAVSDVHMVQAATINGTVRYDQPNVPNPDNSGILAFIRGTSFIGYSQGSSGAYAIANAPSQGSSDAPYTIVAVAGGFADGEVVLPLTVTGTSATAPLMFLTPESIVLGRIIDPTVSDPNKQAVGGASIVAATGQSTTSNSDGVFELRGLEPGSNFITITKSPYQVYRTQVGPLVANTEYFLAVSLKK